MVSRFLIVLLVGASFLQAKSSIDTKAHMHGFVDSLEHHFLTRYAPSQWKQSLHGFDFQKSLQEVSEKIDSENLSIKGFQKELSHFFDMTDDYHCSIYFFSTESSSLPFFVKKVEGDYLFTSIEFSKIDSTVYDIEVGDKLLTIGGRTIDELIAELVKAPHGASPKTEQALAEISLTNRSGQRAHDCPKGSTLITFEKQGTREIKSYELVWSYSPEKILEPVVSKGSISEASHFDLFSKSSELFCNPTASTPHTLGARKSYLPDLGEILWQSPEECSFHAYIYKTEDNKKVGCLRISSYQFGEPQIVELAEILKVFEENTDALVIDQLNNPGGSVFYLYSILSMLSDKPLTTPLHHHQLTQADVMTAWQMLDLLEKIQNNDLAKMFLGETFEGYPVTYQTVQLLKHFYQEVISQWMEGKLHTDPLHMYCIDSINPNPHVQYTKPIVVLINELDFSAGDFFPAILQDNKRATLMGVKTAGAGGYVRTHHMDNLLGCVGYNLTSSLAIRSNGVPIENLGVTPDIAYELKREDIRNNYKPFKEAIYQTVNSLL